jgi:hypothetical protein
MTLEEQFNLGVRLFDLRYHMDHDVFYMSHTFSTSYTVQDALTELIGCATRARQYIYIRMKRDSSSVPLPTFGSFLEPIIAHCAIEYTGQDIYDIIGRQPNDARCVVLYSDDSTMRDDQVSLRWIFSQIFDTIETWDCGHADEAVERIRLKQFRNNGLPKAIFLDFSSVYPPELAFDCVWDRSKDMIADYIVHKEIDCIMINSVQSDIMGFIRVLSA